MIVVCRSFEERLDKVWSQLQSKLAVKGMSQYESDEYCVQFLERTLKNFDGYLKYDSYNESSF